MLNNRNSNLEELVTSGTNGRRKNNCPLNVICFAEGVVYCAELESDNLSAKDTLVALRVNLKTADIIIPRHLEYPNSVSVLG